MARYDLLIGGGADDFNLQTLAAAAEQAGYSVGRFYHQAESEPGFTWDLRCDELRWEGEPLETRSVFQRYDVFTVKPGSGDGALDRALGWHSPLFAWSLAHDEIRMFNRRLHGEAGLKPYTLTCAREHGLRVPDTLISNEISAIEELGDAAIAKPVMGGAYTKTIGAALADAQISDGRTPMPAIIQQKLAYPEYRVFVIGETIQAFKLHSNFIDYRPVGDNAMAYLGDDFPELATIDALLALTRSFRCDFCACDFKTDPETGKAVFLELNTGPMFAAFDAAAEGRLAAAMIEALCG